MWVMVAILINNFSSSDMIHLDNFNAGISSIFDTEEACHNALQERFDKFSKPDREVFIKKNDSNYLTLIVRGKNAIVYTCVPTYKKP
jgi:hypothetical protein